MSNAWIQLKIVKIDDLETTLESDDIYLCELQASTLRSPFGIPALTVPVACRT